ncbi:MAG: hypothetical protein ABI977_24860 [Acidobacteriota bacterium]
MSAEKAVEVQNFTFEGPKVASPEEDALMSRKRAELMAQRAEQEAQRAARLAAKLSELGIDPDSV